jgi:hypothetical protein
VSEPTIGGPWCDRALRAEADAATLRAALLRCYDQWTPPVPDWLIETAMGRTGQQSMDVVCAALAERAELAAARAVVEAGRVAASLSLFEGRGPLVRKIADYDKVAKASKESARPTDADRDDRATA